MKFVDTGTADLDTEVQRSYVEVNSFQVIKQKLQNIGLPTQHKQKNTKQNKNKK
jgi:hypothetical protein